MREELTYDEILLEIWSQRRDIELKTQGQFEGVRLYLGEKEWETILEDPKSRRHFQPSFKGSGDRFMGMFVYVVKVNEPHFKVTD